MEDNKMDLSFSGAGFMGCYYFGVVDCWNKYIPRNRVNRVAGASAGSLIAAYYLMDLPLGECLKEIVGLTEEIRRRPLGVFDRSHQIVDVLPKILDRILPDDAHKRVSNRLHVCITRLKDMKKIIVNEFETKKDLIDALNCSCFIPVWSGNHVATYKGVKHIDGGFSDNLPIFDEHTIRICCFSGGSDISPYDRAKMELLSGSVLNMPLYWNFANLRRFGKALFPPPASYLVELLERGFHDTKDFILSNDLIQCDPCYMKMSLQDQPVYQRGPTPTITPGGSPAISRAGSFRVLNGSMTTALDAADENNNNQRAAADRRTLEPAGGGPQTTKKSFDVLVSEKLLRSCSPADSDCSSAGADRPFSGAQWRNSPSPTITANAIAPTILINDSSVASPDSDADDNCSSSAESDGSDGMQAASSAAAAATGSAASTGNVCKISSPLTGKKEAVPKEQQVPAGLGARRRSTLFQHQPDGVASPSLLVMRDRFTLAPSPLPSCPPSPNLNRHCTECIRLRQEARLDAVEKDIRRAAEQFLGPEMPSIKVGGLRDKLTSPLRWLRTLGMRSSYTIQDATATDTIISNQTTDHQH